MNEQLYKYKLMNLITDDGLTQYHLPSNPRNTNLDWNDEGDIEKALHFVAVER